MATTNDVRPGQSLDLDDGVFQIIDYQHVKPGKGKAFVRMKLRNLDSGAVVDRTFRAGEQVGVAVIDRREFQFLYKDDQGFHFMDLETYDQVRLDEALVLDSANYLTDGMTVILPTYQGKPMGVELPAAVELEVTHTEPGVKGDRVSGATKPVTLVTGLVVQAPLFVEQGETIRVDTRTGDYITRVQ
ncbi:MAG: elongation factor P [Acidimicrobiia bacterium]|nr:elongation factor P [Acidimicrobiia bacterium]MDH3469776.1 elongation factor P [Acidimicrobiia bacterium]